MESDMAMLILTTLLVLLVIYAVPFLVYGAASALGGLQPPKTASPARFLLGVLVTKLGTAVAFVTLFGIARTFWGPRWILYAAVWFLMFAFSEVGDAVSGRSTRVEVLLGIVSEAVYTPLSAFLTQWLLWHGNP